MKTFIVQWQPSVLPDGKWQNLTDENGHNIELLTLGNANAVAYMKWQLGNSLVQILDSTGKVHPIKPLTALKHLINSLA